MKFNEDLYAVSKKMCKAASDKNENRNESRPENHYEGGKKLRYRKMFETPTAYKDYEKDMIKECLSKELPVILEDFKRAYASGEYPDFIKNVLSNKRFIKALKKSYKEFGDDVKTLIGFMIAEQLMKNKEVSGSDELRSSYEEIFFSIYEKPIEKFMDKFGFEENAAKALMLNTAEYSKIKPFHISQRVFKVLNVLYTVADDTKFNFKKVLEKLFENYKDDVIMAILLENRERQSGLSEKGRELWSEITNFVLDTIEEFEKEELKEFIKEYLFRAKKNFQNNQATRISLLNSISRENYPTISKVVNKYIEKDEVNKKYFM